MVEPKVHESWNDVQLWAAEVTNFARHVFQAWHSPQLRAVVTHGGLGAGEWRSGVWPAREMTKADDVQLG